MVVPYQECIDFVMKIAGYKRLATAKEKVDRYIVEGNAQYFDRLYGVFLSRHLDSELRQICRKYISLGLEKTREKLKNNIREKCEHAGPLESKECPYCRYEILYIPDVPGEHLPILCPKCLAWLRGKAHW